jgi:hypothetical protein
MCADVSLSQRSYPVLRPQVRPLFAGSSDDASTSCFLCLIYQVDLFEICFAMKRWLQSGLTNVFDTAAGCLRS